MNNAAAAPSEGLEVATSSPTSKQRRPSKFYDTTRKALTALAMVRRPQGKKTSNDPVQDFEISVNVKHGVLKPPNSFGNKPAVKVTIDVLERWTIQWSGIEDVLPSGICLLFEYPAWKHVPGSEGSNAGRGNDDATHMAMPTSKRKESTRTLESMETLILELVKQTAVSKLVDASGARFIHALVVANTKESLELAQKLFVWRPRLLLDVHGKCERRKVDDAHLQRHWELWSHREVDELVAKRERDIAIYEGEGSLHSARAGF